MGDMLIVLDINDNISMVNREVLNLLEYDNEELVGKSIIEIFNMEDNEARVLFTEPFCRDGATGDNIFIHEHELLCRKKNGDDIPVSISGALMSCGYKDEKKIVVTAHNISERKKAEAALKKERDYSMNIINGTPAIICGIGLDGTTNFINTAGEQLLNYSFTEIVG